MAKIKLKSALSFKSRDVFLKAGEVKEVDDARAEELVSLGYCVYAGDVLGAGKEEIDLGEVVSHASAEHKTGPESLEAGVNPVKKLKKEQLIAYAEAKGYDISECIRVEEIRSKIIELDELGAESNKE